MDICEVYALNIMPQDIARFIGCLKTEVDKIEECRKDFLNFLLDKQAQGVLYYSQLTAWLQFKETGLHEDSVTFEHIDQDEEEILDMSWTEELELLAYMKANTIEFLGNYDYESIKGKSLPSQQ